MSINFISVNEKLKEMDCSDLSLTVLDNYKKNCTIMRVQLEARLSYNSEIGPYVLNDKHDDKCRALLQLEKQSPSDLVIFPEYCISYNIIDEVVANSTFHPSSQKLWCLPCQGISSSDFIEKMEQYKKLGAIIIDDAYIDVDFQQKQYINALIYCFMSIDRDGVSCLTVIPQIKTYPMRDITYQCEEPHMCCGNTIFTFGNSAGIGLLSLLCADSLNPQISWVAIKRQARNLIVLHPQLNANPKQENFRSIRTEMFGCGEKHVYISCNWAKGTNVADENGALAISINNSWSCIYYKQNQSYDIKQWHEKNMEQLKKNASHLLYAGFMKDKKVAIWYAGSCELSHKFILQKPYYDGPAVLNSGIYVVIHNGLSWESSKWIEIAKEREMSYRKSCYEEYLDSEYKELFDIIIADEKYNFPLVCNCKGDSDSFFELVFGEDILTYIGIDANETLMSPTIIIDNDTKEHFQSSCFELHNLILQLQSNNFPKHLAYYSNNHHFELCMDFDAYTNLSTNDNSKKMIVAIAKNQKVAQCFIDNMLKTTLKKYSKKMMMNSLI